MRLRGRNLPSFDEEDEPSTSNRKQRRRTKTNESVTVESVEEQVAVVNQSEMIYLSALRQDDVSMRQEDVARGEQDGECSTSSTSSILPPLISPYAPRIPTHHAPIHSEPFTQPCAYCQLCIIDEYKLVVDDRPYHPSCLRCVECNIYLSESGTCFVKEGHIYCKQDYMAKFCDWHCFKCNGSLSEHDVVMRARHAVFHLQCFTCVVCAMPLNSGDLFTMKDNGHLYCQMHYEPVVVPALLEEPPPSNKQRKEDSDEHEEYGEDEQHPGNGRSKRMRTSFKHQQLRTMKNYFNLNHNPDAKDLKQLAQKTGLTKRVLQVWFQNARAKYRRSVNGREGGSISPLHGMNVHTSIDTQYSDTISQHPSSSSNHSSECRSSSPEHATEYYPIIHNSPTRLENL